MNTAPDPLTELLHETSLTRDAVELRLFVDLCRSSRRLRVWLFGRFASEPKTRAAFRAVLAGRIPADFKDGPWSPGPMRKVASKPAFSEAGTGRHGGLSEAKIVALIKRFQAGRMDVTAFLFVRLWLRFLGQGEDAIPVALWRPTLAFWAAIIRDPRRRIVRHLAKALRFFRERTDRSIGEADFSFAASWKIHVLLYIWDYPKPCYRVGELRDNLPVKYRELDRKDIREFCTKYGIRRDSRAGEQPAVSGRKSARKLPTPAHSSRSRSMRLSHPQSTDGDKSRRSILNRPVMLGIRSRV